MFSRALPFAHTHAPQFITVQAVKPICGPACLPACSRAPDSRRHGQATRSSVGLPAGNCAMAWSLPAEAPNSWTAQARQARHWQHGSCAHGGRLASLHLCPWRLPHTSSAQTTEHRRRVWTARSTTLGPKPVLTPESRGICSVCGGTGHVACKQCQGSGWLQRGGFNRKNPVPKNPISSKW